MQKLYKTFLRKVDRLRDRADNLRKSNLSSWQVVYCQEGLTSEAWQAWNNFCKNLLVLSCQGCTGCDGHMYPARAVPDNSVFRVAYEYKHYKNANTQLPPLGKTIIQPWSFPTWGDSKYIINVISGLSPHNKTNLITAFSLPLVGISELQEIRNTLFHKENEKINELSKYYYINYSIREKHPASIIFATKNNTLMYYSWLDDMYHIAFVATK